MCLTARRNFFCSSINKRKIITSNLFHLIVIQDMIKTHGSVSCGPRSPGHVQMGVSIITGTTKKQFSRIHRSVIVYLKITKFAVEVPGYKGRQHAKIKVNHASCFRDTSEQIFRVFFPSSSFNTNYKIGSNSQARILNWLKFGTLVESKQANSGSNFSDNSGKFHGVTNVCSHKQRSNFRHAYRVNHFVEMCDRGTLIEQSP